MKLLSKYIVTVPIILFLISCTANELSNSQESQNNIPLNAKVYQDTDIAKSMSSQSSTIISNSQNGIIVSGSSSVRVDADIIEISVGIEATNLSVSNAVEEVSFANNILLNILDKNKIKEKEIATTRYTISPQYQYSQGKSKLTGYKVTHNTKFKYRDLKNVGSLIDQLSTGPNSVGNNLRINSINFSIENPSKYETELRKNAVNNAIQKAQSLADYAGVSLGTPFYISEHSPTNFAQPLPESDMMMTKMAYAAPSTEINSGQLTITFNVNMGFSIK
tara:strand:- start:11035 stop:11865 length:831 start_codon:yes stop_codon:yes gene_type:complete